MMACAASIAVHPAAAIVAMTRKKQEEGVAFVVEAEEVARMQAESGLTLEMFLASLVKPTLAMARPPISGFHVGAVGLGISGRVFRGVNLEFPGLPLQHSVHAEQCLVANAGQHGEERLTFIAVSAAPCGHCRQFLQELRGAGDMRLVIVDPEVEVHSLSHLLPRRFGPHDLLAEGFPLLLEPHVNNLLLMDDTLPGKSVAAPSLFSPMLNGVHSLAGVSKVRNFRCAIHSNGTTSSTTLTDWSMAELKAAALEAAKTAYAPYSGCPSGLAMVSSKGRVFRGSYMESAAYNPSLSPLQSAMIAFVTQGGGSYEDIVEAVLVETVGCKVQHAATVELALLKIAPNCSLHVLLAHPATVVPSPL